MSILIRCCPWKCHGNEPKTHKFVFWNVPYYWSDCGDTRSLFQPLDGDAQFHSAELGFTLQTPRSIDRFISIDFRILDSCIERISRKRKRPKKQRTSARVAPPFSFLFRLAFQRKQECYERRMRYRPGAEIRAPSPGRSG